MNKKVIIGKWIFRDNKMIADSNCGIIELMIKNEFVKLESSEDGWTTRYKRNDSEIWELSYPENHLQGGGPPKLIQIK
ncbi:Imm27 family immunity protein [Lutibacter agarilyticus]|nr:Imm27 family immunity protein [Lutibacter agarilyticus]